MSNAARDENSVPTLIGVSNADGTTPVKIYADPTTHRLLVDLSGSGSISGPVSSTDNAIVRWNGTSGDTIQDSNIIIDDSDNITGAANITATGATLSGLTASELVATDGSKNLQSLAVVTYPSLTEISYVKGVTSAIQTQLDAKGTGDVTKVGTPVDNQIGVWTGDGTIEGDTGLTWDGSALSVDGSVVFNESGADVDFRIEGANTPNAIFVQGSDGFVGFGTNTPAQIIELSFAAPAIRFTDTTAGAEDIDLFLNEDIFKIIHVDTKDLITVNADTGDIGLAPISGDVNIGTLTASELIATDASKNLQSLPVATYPSLTELTYVKGVTSAIQTQLDTKITASSTDTLTNKSIDLANNTLTGTAAEFDTACSDDNFAFVSDNLSVFAATTSAQLAGVISDETGSGSLVFGTSPTLTTPRFADAGYIADSNGNEQLRFQETASAVNHIDVTNAATGNAPKLSAVGDDTNIDLELEPKGTGIVKGELKSFAVRLKDSTTALATGTTIGGDYRVPGNRAITITAVGAYVDTAAATGTNKLTIDINEAGTTILSTKITIDVGEKTSTTAATAPVISDSAIAADAIITYDIDQVNETTPATGLVVWFEYKFA